MRIPHDAADQGESTPLTSNHEAKTTPFSRRGFLKRLSQMGAALGLGVAGVAATSKTAHACDPDSYYDYKFVYSSCGTCKIDGSVARVRTKYRRTCRMCATGEVCSAWERVGTACVLCA